MISKEEWNIMLERETASEFIHVRTYNKEWEVYETANGFYAKVFRIFPSPYLGQETSNKIGAFLSLDYPDDSVIQFITYASRNINNYIQRFDYIHSNPNNDPHKKVRVDNPEMLVVIKNSSLEWLKKYSNRSIFEKQGVDVFLRDFINLAIVMVPLQDSSEEYRTKPELDSVFAQVKGALSDFSPMEFHQQEYVKMMREILNPSFPMWNPPADTTTELNSQIVDSRSAIELDDSGKIIFGSIIKDDGSSVQIDSQVEVPKTFGNKIKKYLYDNFGIGNPPQQTVKINPSWYANVLTTKLYPEYTDLMSVSDMLMDYFSRKPQPLIPLPFLLTLTLNVGNRDKMTKTLQEDAKWNMFQLSNAAGAAKFMPELKLRAEEADEVLKVISTKGEIPFKAMWSLTIFGEEEETLDRYTASVQKEFLQKNWRLQKEELIQFPVLLFSLPMQFDEVFFKWSQRFNTLFRANNTSIVPLLTDARGFGENVIQLIGRNGQLQGLDVYNSSANNKNFVTIAPAGSGKSYFMANFFLNYLMTGAKIRIIDSGESYMDLCEMIGGRYIRFDDDKSNRPCLNFFSDINVDENGQVTEEAIESILPIIGMMARQNLNEMSTGFDDSMNKSVVSYYVTTAIKEAYSMEGENAGMEEVLISLKNQYAKQKRQLDAEASSFNPDVDKNLRGLINSLQSYGNKSGEYYSYFNGRKNINFSENDFVVLEMMELDTKGNLRNVVLMALTYVIENEFYFDDRRRKKILAIDEAWSLLSDPIVAKFIEGLYRKARKFNGSIGTITQSIQDFYGNDDIQTLFENAYWKFFLQPDPEGLNKAVEEKKLSIDPFTLELMKSIRTEKGVFSEVMIRTGSGATSLGRLVSTRVLHWIFTTDDDEVAQILNVSERFNIDKKKIALAIGYAEDKCITIQEAVDEILSINGKKNQENENKTSMEDMLSMLKNSE